MFEIFEEIKEEMKEIYLNTTVPIVLGTSFGKDSCLQLDLFWDMLLSLQKDQLHKTVHVVCAETGVETPQMEEYITRSILKVQRKAELQGLPIQTHLVKPVLQKSFFYKILGRGTLIPTPNTKTRWCTHKLKIEPMREKLAELLALSPVNLENHQQQLILCLAVRNEESARRRESIKKFEKSANSKWARHTDFDTISCWHAIKHISSDELWYYLLEKGTLSFGLDINELIQFYGEDILECGIKTSGDQGKSCGGNSRNGCWTCGLISGQDKMLTRFIEKGQIDYTYLLNWKNLMLRMRNDIRYREVLPRQKYNKLKKSLSTKITNEDQLSLYELNEVTEVEKYVHDYESFDRANYIEYAPGALTVEGRRILLEYLLFIQKKTGYSLITEIEIRSILDCWRETDGIIIAPKELIPRETNYDGELIFLPNKKINKKLTKNPNPVFYVNIDFKMGEAELFKFLKDRQQATGQSFFFFPNSVEFKNEKLVWNSVSIVVCKSYIQTSIEAHEEAFGWLGWNYKHFTETTKKAALNHLMLSAIGEGIKQKENRLKEKRLRDILNKDLPLEELDNGQLTLAF
ncbi:hypothetical protein CJ195_15790 [Bacillus sp. UMB0899]|nr:hypothetical protein CJ195_15790 [Bacillus sp. UMB0899]